MVQNYGTMELWFTIKKNYGSMDKTMALWKKNYGTIPDNTYGTSIYKGKNMVDYENLKKKIYNKKNNWSFSTNL